MSWCLALQVTAHDIGTLDQGLKQWVSVVRTGVRPNVGFGIVPEQQPCEVLGWVLETVQELKCDTGTGRCQPHHHL